MPIRVKFLAVLKPLASSPELLVDPSINSLEQLVEYLTRTQPKQFVDRFISHESRWLRPDILVFIKGVDARLLGHKSAKLSDGDEVVFLPTVHGG
ncbi:MAG: hypothetical protein DRJ33_05615 [Candidatus Methanomethylicota archaeon]|uniref:Molybdopterin synthase sulfur carrier subunit n=1 Tax=Thermoproteota archaeon TaxID=2056631 RepID=A0A497EW25_9CREN|nr:MAG: hypothetical protein DRJ33_05615 [Candidatus Verstraetearchaeota archaeon]